MNEHVDDHQVNLCIKLEELGVSQTCDADSIDIDIMKKASRTRTIQIEDSI